MENYRLVKQLITNAQNNGAAFYKYNEKGMLLLQELYNDKNKYYCTYKYFNNAMGLPLFRETYNYEKNRIINYSGYEYDTNGLLIRLNQFDPGRLEGLYKYTTFEYNGSQKIRQTIISCEGKEEVEDILYFEYSNGHKIRTLNKNNEIIGTFEYNENGLLQYALLNDSKIEFVWENGNSLYRHNMYWFF